MQTSQIDMERTLIGVEQGARLSYQQERVWSLITGQETGMLTAVIPTVQCGLRIEGKLDAAHLREALQKVVDRHEALRTSFSRISESQDLVQVPAATGSLAWRSLDLSDCGDEEKVRRIRDHRNEDSRSPFVLDGHPLLRASLLMVAPDEHILVLTLPALCADASSLQILISETISWYVSGSLPSANEEVIQYSSISEWQRSLQQEENAEQARQFWNAQPAFSEISFALQRAPRAERCFSPSSRMVSLSSNLQSRLMEIEREDVFLLGCWFALLRLITGQPTMGIGVAFHGRGYEELQQVIGPIARIVPIGCTLREEMRFVELVQALTEAVDMAEDWQEFYERNADAKPYETVAFEFSRWPSMNVPGCENRFTVAFEHAWHEPFHLKLSLNRSGDDLLAQLDFDPDVFDPQYVASLCDQLATLIEGALEDRHSVVERLPILSNKEQQFLLEACNNTKADYPADALVHQLIMEQAARTPHRIATAFEDRHLTYRELDQRANQLAHRLQQMHIGPEARVAIFMHRSVEMVVAILAVLKAGGAYVPFEPTYPAERLSFMVEDARVAMILTEEQLSPRLPKSSAKVLCLDAEMDALTSGQPLYAPRTGACSDNLAYVLYTSGSTGRPKGAMISHRSLLNYLVWSCKAYALESGTGSPVHSSIGFDATITALFPALLAGRTITLVEESEGVDALSRAMEQEEAFSLIKITPAHLSLLNEFVAGNQLATKTKMLVIGGDALAGSRLSGWRQQAPQTRFINEYGPTETVVGCCVHEAVDEDLAGNSVPIGRPIANTQLYVLDRSLRPVPVGVPGELFIGGEGVCRGYLGRPTTTAERFLPDRFSGAPGKRVYRTGDLVVQRADGVLCFLGRLDHQVKIRSYRIELGEIEAQLELHPAVSQSVVVAPVSATGDRFLVAYIQHSGSTSLRPDELRAFLLEKLPEYMVPSTFVILDKLPLTAHGKVDRNALPDPTCARTSSFQQHAAPRTQAEELLASIWRDVLKLEHIGIHDDFFRSGGDSIQSILVVARAAKAGLRFTTRDLFRNPTIAGLAAIAENSGTAATPSCQAQGAVPLSPIQHWFFEQHLPNPNHFNQSVLLEVRADLRTEWVKRALEELVAHHDALRLRFVRQENEWHQSCSNSDNSFAFEEIDLDALSASDLQQAMDSTVYTAQSQLNIETGPVIRAVLFRNRHESSGKLLLTVHHLVVDGVSWRILLDDFTSAYQQLVCNRAIQLPPATDTFKSWSTRLLDYASTDSLSGEAKYWLKQHSAAIGCIPEDFEMSRDRNAVSTSANVHVMVGSQTTFKLLHSVSDVYRTEVDDLLLTALALALTRWNGSPANLIDCEGHGREDLFPDADVSRTVGWFTSIYPLLLDLNGANSLGEQLKAVKEQRRGVPRKGIGYGVLRYLSRDPEVRNRLAAQPHSEISFNYLGVIDAVTADPITGIASLMVVGEQGPMNHRAYPLEVIAYVQNGSLQVQIVYSTALHEASTIERLAHDMIGYLESLVDYCLSPSAGGLTPSDFPDIELSQAELDELEAELE